MRPRRPDRAAPVAPPDESPTVGERVAKSELLTRATDRRARRPPLPARADADAPRRRTACLAGGRRAAGRDGDQWAEAVLRRLESDDD